jgi:hypothetical protein
MTTYVVERNKAGHKDVVQYDDVEDQIERWIARLEIALDRLEARQADHEKVPWHTGYSPMMLEQTRRLDRLESAAIKVMAIVCGLLASIAGLLIWIVFVAEKIAASKPAP